MQKGGGLQSAKKTKTIAERALNNAVEGGGLQSAKKTKTIAERALNNAVEIKRVKPHHDDKNDMLVFLSNMKSTVEDTINNRRTELRDIKWYINVKVKMVKHLDEGNEQTSFPHFRSNTYTSLLNDNDVEHKINEAFQKAHASMEEFINKGSNWTLDEVLEMEISTVQYSPLGGSSYIPFPTALSKSKSIINIQNKDQKCFLWSVLAALHSITVDHPERVNVYEQFQNDLNMSGIEYPVSLSQIKKIEKQNQISINVYGYEKGAVFPLYITKLDGVVVQEIDLLYLKEENQTHYCWIKSLSRLLHSTTAHKRSRKKHYYCRRCLHGFRREDLLHEHVPFCKLFDFQRVQYPVEGKNDILAFKEFHKQIRIPMVVYADFETINKKIDTCAPDPQKSSTIHETRFEPCGYAYQVVCSNDKYTKAPVVYRGENAAQHFLEAMMKEEVYIRERLADIEPLKMTNISEMEFQNATHCSICTEPFNNGSIKVRDHHHIGVTGHYDSPAYTNFRGASCQSCNLNFKYPKFIPVIFHNLRGFDSHILCQAIGKYKKENITCISQNMEKYMTLSLGNLRFLDSFQFMSSSLETLVDNLSKDGLDSFRQFQKYFPDKKIAEFLLRKNIFPYDHIDSFDVFDQRVLPRKKHFTTG